MSLMFVKACLAGVLVLFALAACGDGPIPAIPDTPTAVTPNSSQPSEDPTQAGGPGSRDLRFLALGDSYTIGQSVDITERWPLQLARRMADSGTAVLEPEIIAQTGWTTSELSAAIDQAAPEGIFDIVTLLIGVNDQFRGSEIDRYQREFAGLLETTVAFTGGDSSRVIVLSIPDWGVTPFAQGRDRGLIARWIDDFNSVNLAETDRAGARYVDVTGISRQAITQPLLIADDGLHPSGEMYARWVDAVLPAALEIAGEAD